MEKRSKNKTKTSHTQINYNISQSNIIIMTAIQIRIEHTYEKKKYTRKHEGNNDHDDVIRHYIIVLSL